MPNRNPYVQVTLTYVRRPFSSWFARLASALFLGMFIWFSLADRAGFKDPVFVQLMLFFSLFIALALHMKGQFVDSRARLTPGFRRVHATVAAVATLTAAVVLPAGLSWFMGWHGIGFVAVVMLLFGTILWVIVKDATWTVFAILLGWSAFCSTQSGPAWFRELLSGQIEFQATAILVLGILITLFAGIRLVRLNAEAMTYDSTLRWDWDWSQKTRQGWTGDGRILRGLRDWIRAREMTRLVRLARSASESWWSRTCRWQVGMSASRPLWFWVLGTLIVVQAMNWWMATRSPRPELAALCLTSLVLTIVPALISSVGVLQRPTFRLEEYELLLPVTRKDYITQVGLAAALSHLQLWGILSAALVLWWVLAGPRPLRFALFGEVLTFSAAFQLGMFGVAVWIARFRSRVSGNFALTAILTAATTLQLGWVRSWSLPNQWPWQMLSIAGMVAVLGVLITLDAYRRWLAADFDGPRPDR